MKATENFEGYGRLIEKTTILIKDCLKNLTGQKRQPLSVILELVYLDFWF